MAPTTSATPPQPPPPPGAPVKKKTSPWVWVLVGCLGLFVVGGVIFGVATFFIAKKAKDFVQDVADNPVKTSVEMMVRMNPELELVSSDAEAETTTVRNKTTGEVSTFNWVDIQDGKMSFETDGKEYTIDGSGVGDGGGIEVRDESGDTTMSFGGGDVPSWFPQYHNAADVAVLVNTNQDGNQSTIWTFTTTDGVGDVVSFYQQRLGSDGWEVTTSNADQGGTVSGSVDARQDGGAKNLNLVISQTGSDPSQAMVTYTEGGAN
jgi:uncharacterized protein YneF (UPF0154 family)